MGTEISGSTGIDKIQNNAVDIADLSATGTASASTFLRGDNSWTAVDALPTQSGNAGKFLTTDASSASWATVDALPAQSGNAGMFLTTDASTASWAEAGGGKILQVVQGSTNNTVAISSTTLVTTGLSANITPSSTSNKILVMAQIHYYMHASGGQDCGLGWAIGRGSSNPWQTTEPYATYNYGGSQLNHKRDYVFIHYLDSPSTTSNTTYTIRCRRHSGSSTIQVQGNSHDSIITLMEVVG